MEKTDPGEDPVGNTYIEINRKLWNKRTAFHVQSEFYDVAGFLEGKNTLNSIELDLLGDVKGKKILHLQCHFGLDSLSMARMGAQVTGVDLSDAAIDKANELSATAGLSARFICCNLYDLPAHLNETFDLVFSSYGTIGWLPDLNSWAGVITRYLKPGGKFVFAEFHPVIWMFDNDFREIIYRYFKSGPVLETESGTYADPDAVMQLPSVSWNHGLAEVFSALLGHGLTITAFEEYDFSPYPCFKDMVETTKGKYRLQRFGDKLPMVYALKAE